MLNQTTKMTVCDALHCTRPSFGQRWCSVRHRGTIALWKSYHEMQSLYDRTGDPDFIMYATQMRHAMAERFYRGMDEDHRYWYMHCIERASKHRTIIRSCVMDACPDAAADLTKVIHKRNIRKFQMTCLSLEERQRLTDQWSDAVPQKSNTNDAKKLLAFWSDKVTNCYQWLPTSRREAYVLWLTHWLQSTVNALREQYDLWSYQWLDDFRLYKHNACTARTSFLKSLPAWDDQLHPL